MKENNQVFYYCYSLTYYNEKNHRIKRIKIYANEVKRTAHVLISPRAFNIKTLFLHFFKCCIQNEMSTLCTKYLYLSYKYLKFLNWYLKILYSQLFPLTYVINRKMFGNNKIYYIYV